MDERSGPPARPPATSAPDATTRGDGDALRTLEARYRALVLATGQITWTARGDSHGGWSGDGRDWSVFTGQDEAASSAWGWLAALHPEDRERATVAWEAAVASNGTFEIDYRVRRHDGAFRWLLVRGVPIVVPGEGGAADEVREWVGTATDITERKQMEEQLHHLHTVTAAFASAQGLADVRAVILGEVVRALGARGAGLRLITAAGLVLEEHALGAAPVSAASLRRFAVLPLTERHPAVEAANSGEPVFLHDAAESMRRYPNLAGWVRRDHIEAAAHLPLTRGDEVFGVLSLPFAEARAWSESERSFAQALAGRAAIAYERARLLEAERASRERLRLFIEHAPAAVAMLDRSLCYLAVSRRWLQDYGLGEDEASILGRSHYEVFPDLPEEWKAVHRRCLAGAVERSTGERYERADGSSMWLAWEVRPWYVQPGEVGGLVVFSEDITEHRHAAEALAEREALFRTLADNIPQLAWMAHADGNIFWYNRRWYEYTGTTLASQEGWGWRSVHSAEELPRVLERWERSIATGEPFDMVFPLRGADGTFRPFLTRIMPVKDAQGRVVRWFGTNTDVSEQQASEAALRAANRALEAANAAKDEFLSIASHELRTPLTSAMSNLEIAARRLAHSLAESDATITHTQAEGLAHLLRRSGHALSRLGRLVDDLLDVSRIEAGRLALRTARIELVEVARAVIEDVMLAWPGREVRLEGLLATREGTASGDAQLWVVADPDRIRQVVTNFLTNALKYAPRAQPITVRLIREASMARLEVQDDGPGLTAEQQRRVFERFYRVEGIHHQQGSGIGLGLGLYICHEIVTAHGGAVGVESTPGAGATFWCTLPLAPAD